MCWAVSDMSGIAEIILVLLGVLFGYSYIKNKNDRYIEKKKEEVKNETSHKSDNDLDDAIKSKLAGRD